MGWHDTTNVMLWAVLADPQLANLYQLTHFTLPSYSHKSKCETHPTFLTID